MKRISLLTLCSLLVSSAVFAAEEHKGANAPYDFVEIRFVDVENGPVDGDGLSFAGSYRLDDQFFIEGNYRDLDFGSGIDITTLGIGAGYIMPYKEVDLVARVNLLDSDFPGGSDSGFLLAYGFRYFLEPQVELRANVNYVDFDESDTFIDVAADYYFNKDFAVGIALNLGAENDEFSIGGRYFF